MPIAIMPGLPKKGKTIDEPLCPCPGVTKNIKDNALMGYPEKRAVETPLFLPGLPGNGNEG